MDSGSWGGSFICLWRQLFLVLSFMPNDCYVGSLYPGSINTDTAGVAVFFQILSVSDLTSVLFEAFLGLLDH